MEEQVITRLLVSAGLALAGLCFLGYSAWARHGGSPAARRWVGTEFTGNSFDERMTVLGAPMVGVICWCAAAIALPVVGTHLMLVALPIGGLAFVLLCWALLRFIPLPEVLYPRWARPIRRHHRRMEAELRSSLRRR